MSGVDDLLHEVTHGRIANDSAAYQDAIARFGS